MLKNLFIVLGALLISSVSSAQSKYWVYYSDKNDVSMNPTELFSHKAIERRVKQGIDFPVESDLPVNSEYVRTVSSLVAQEKVTSRWFNASCVIADESQIAAVRELPFVRKVEKADRVESVVCGFGSKSRDESKSFELDEYEREFAVAQINRMQGDQFIKKGVNGKGVRIAIFDIGFESWKTNPAFEHLRKNNQILKTYDFVKNRENVDGYNTHGTFVLSCVAGKIGDQHLGLATGAEFLLARTETWTEFFGEEENWLAAAEWADKEGADIINSSLGYTYHRYFREQMNGRTSFISRAASMAVSKGILVVNAAGNDGDNDWKIIGAPADNDSVLSIGGIRPNSGIHTNFSSFGPTAERKLKPNVCSYGHVIGSGPKGVSETQGTSFSSPLVAGFAACAKQMRPAYNTMALFHEIEKSADLYPYYDYAHGYGVPQAGHFLGEQSTAKDNFKFINENTQVRIELAEVDTSIIDDEEPEFQFTKWPDFVFYHIENKRGYLDKYYVVDPVDYMEIAIRSSDMPETEEADDTGGPLVISKADYKKPFTIRAYYKGTIKEIIIE